MQHMPLSNPILRFMAIGLINLWVLTLPVPLLAQEAPPAQTQPSLVEKLLSILGNKNIPRIDIPAPPQPDAAPSIPSAPSSQPSSGQASGPEIAQSFLPIYDFDKSDAEDETPPVLPFFSTSPVNQVHKGIATLVILIHDQTREAAKAFAFARSAQEEAIARHPEWNADTSYIFTPQFLNSEDIAGHAQHWPDGGAALLRWVNNSWIFGSDSVVPGRNNIWQAKKGMSSFAVMDFLLLLLARPKLFPDLQKVVIAGTSSGADFVQRYAALGIAPAILADEGIEMRFALAQTRSFLYLDDQRFMPKRDDPLMRNIESDAFTKTQAQDCKAINRFPYGLDDLPLYGRKNAVNEVRLNYSSKRIIYLAGAGAGLPLSETTPDACALNAQGTTIRKRSEIFYASLKRIYGDEVTRMQKLYLIEGINEDGLALWRNACGGAALFGDGTCNPGDVGSPNMRIIR